MFRGEHYDKKFFYLEGETPAGPLTFDDLLDYFLEGILDSNSSICVEGTENWKKISEFTEIYKFFKDVEGESLEVNEKAEEDASEIFDELKRIEELQNLQKKEIPKEEIPIKPIENQGIVIENKEEIKEEPKEELKVVDQEIINEKKKKSRQKKEKKQNKKKKIEEGWVEPKYKTNVYVTGIPADLSLKEFISVFSKYGVLKEDMETHEPKAKLYKNEDGSNKGDGVIHYLREDSVGLAIQFLDNYEIKPGHHIHVEIAEFKQKEGVVKKKQVINKKKKDHRLNWGIDKGRVSEQSIPNIVILKHMFSLDGFATDPLFENNLKADVKEECEKFGTVEKVRVFKKNPEGIIEVRFHIPTSAKKCIDALNGRFFDGNTIEASLWDYKTKYNQFEDEDDEEERYEKFTKSLTNKDIEENIEKIKE